MLEVIIITCGVSVKRARRAFAAEVRVICHARVLRNTNMSTFSDVYSSRDKSSGSAVVSALIMPPPP